jgi:hypothetical protein
MVYVRRLKERQNVIEVFRVTHPHGFLVLEAPEPKCWCGQVIAQKYTLLCAIIVSGIGDVRMLPWQMTCHIGAKNMPVTFKIMTERVRPQFVELFPRGMTAGVGRKERRGGKERREATEATGVIDEREDTCRYADDRGDRFSYRNTIGYSNTIAGSQQIVNG